MSDDTYPDQITKPRPKVVKLDPLPPLPKGLIAKLLWPLLKLGRWRDQADLDRRQRGLDEQCAEYNAAALRVWEVENALAKRRHVVWRIDYLERQSSERAREVAVVEWQVRDGWAEYQLKRDYWGEMDVDTLRAEYRQVVRSLPAIGLLRESKAADVLAIVGNVAALPPPAASLTDVKTELARLKRLRDQLPEYTPLSKGDPAEAARLDRINTRETGAPLSERHFWHHFKGFEPPF